MGVHRLELRSEPVLISDGPGLYPDRLACMWVLRASTPIRLVFNAIFTEVSDVLTVMSTAGTIIAEVSGTARPAPISTNETFLVITFKSNLDYHYSGFELSATAQAPDGTWPSIPAPARIADPPGEDSVTFACIAETASCPPSGRIVWSCSTDCLNEECDMNLQGFGLIGVIPEIGELKCASRIARVYVAPPPHHPPIHRLTYAPGNIQQREAHAHSLTHQDTHVSSTYTPQHYAHAAHTTSTHTCRQNPL